MTVKQFQFCSVSREYDGRPVLSDLSFALVAGGHTAILGTSGCGKSTTLRLLAGLEVPSSGRILLDGKVISEAGRVVTPPHRRGVAMVFQDLALWPNLSVRENALLGLSGTGLPRSERKRRADEALDLCGIQPLADRKPGSLSGGQQQRVALARALAARPTFLLLDEPFAGLDLVTKDRVLREIAEATAKHEATVLIVSHDPMEVTTLCRTALVLDQGRVQESGTWEELLRDPRSEILTIFKARLRGLQCPPSSSAGPTSV